MLTTAFITFPQELFWTSVLVVAIVGTLSSTIYLGLVVIAAWSHRRKSRSSPRVEPGVLPPVTLLKPLHGIEPRLFENLETFFQQDYPDFEIIFGARDEENGALQVANEARAKYPGVKTRVVHSGPPTWPNAKVFSLNKMIAQSQNDYLVITDSDIRVPRDFLRAVIPPLLESKTGLVTCLYQGIPTRELSSRLEALGMSVELPSGVLVAEMIEGMRFALGAVMAVRRDALDKIGGIAATADYYSDDFVLGNKIWESGFSVRLIEAGVGHVLMPRSWKKTLDDQLRWMKSTRYSRPLGHIGTGLTYAMPFGVLGWIAGWVLLYPVLGISLLLAAILNRIAQSLIVGWGVVGDRQALRFCWLYPLRDLLGFVVWIASFTGRRFSWRGEIYSFGTGGHITPQQRQAQSPTQEPM